MSQFPNSLPGIGSSPLQYIPKAVFLSDTTIYDYLPQGRIIDGANARDPSNSAVNVAELQGGLLLGKITASKLLGASIIDVTTAALTTTGTSLTISAAGATELVRRIGATGTFTLVGPPAAAGTVASTTITYSAVNTSTGAVTISTTGTAYITGSFVCPTDGSQIPTTFVVPPQSGPIRVTDNNGNNQKTPLPLIPVTDKTIDVTQLVNYPTDTSLISYVKSNLRIPVPGLTFSDDF